ncbi:hypothetical protein NQ318_006939 [Aromia moschata]|uniref:C2H2-type domain-containing protein n=1 Tax=Aromia moschata TaxID=1265417 RepID=A0AAV8YNX9_9CUCU|nr:hypothetical protein NQ318_006939 [Aromia moschata]
MKEDKLVICRFCLDLTEDGSFDLLDDVKKRMLADIVPELKLNVVKDPVICKCCSTSLQQSYDFKTDYSNYFENMDIKPKDEEYILKCVFCCTTNGTLSSIKENISLKVILEKCWTELSISESTSVCEVCLESLQNQYNFTMKCLETEEKLTAYSSKSGTNSFGILLADYAMLHFLGDKGCNEINLFSILHEIQRHNIMDIANSYKAELVCVKKEEPDSYEKNATETNKIQFVNIKAENAIQEENVEIKCDKEEDSEATSDKKAYKCDLCDYQTYRKTDLTLRHILIHKKPEEVTMYKCTECCYQSKRRGDLNSHLAIHADTLTVYRCHSCHYKTIHKDRLEEHLGKHDLPEKYKCEHCSFKASYKKVFTKHLKTHQRPPRKGIYQCEQCPYQTKRRTDLTDKHMLTHKNPEEVVMHKCQYCNFQAKHKSSLNRHVLKHLPPKETLVYECPQCDFKTKQKRYLTNHLITHKPPEEVLMYKCNMCPYKAKLKVYLRRHKTIRHADAPAVFNCDLCLYETKVKANLQRHVKKCFSKTPEQMVN